MRSNLSTLKDVLEYDGEQLRWKVRTRGHLGYKEPGSVAGWINGQGYRVVGGARIPGRYQQAHRIIWSFLNGEIPEGMMIDHIDGNKLNNRIENLRCVSAQDNLRNMKRSRLNKTGTTGVVLDRGKWRARMSINNRTVHLGTYTSKEDAMHARAIANILCGFHANHGEVR
jgi:hypothetical protein